MSAVNEVLRLIAHRQSSKGGFDPQRPVDWESIRLIVEAARWAPSAHNMQNFEIVVVDDKSKLTELGRVETWLTEDYLREHYETLSFTEDDLLRRKIGLLGTGAPQSWRDPSKFAQVARETPPSPLSQGMKGSPVVLVVFYDPRKRAPASEGDFLGIVSIGCMLENVWLAANSLGIGVKVLSSFGDQPGEKEVKRILGIPAEMRVAFGICLGYPFSQSSKYLRVRRDVESMAHHNSYGTKL